MNNELENLTHEETIILSAEMDKAVNKYGIQKIPGSYTDDDQIQFIWTSDNFRVSGLLFLSIIFDRLDHSIYYIMEHKKLSSDCTESEFYAILYAVTELKKTPEKIEIIN